MKGPIQVEIRAFAFANTPILQYFKTARILYRQTHSTLNWPQGPGFTCCVECMSLGSELLISGCPVPLLKRLAPDPGLTFQF
jgi:hypothetical protein